MLTEGVPPDELTEWGELRSGPAELVPKQKNKELKHTKRKDSLGWLLMTNDDVIDCVYVYVLVFGVDDLDA